MNYKFIRMIQHLENKLINNELLQKGKGIMQNKYHQWDVFDHSLEVVNAIKEKTSDLTVVASGYLHDFGKILNAKYRIKNGEIQRDENGNPYHIFDEPERHEETGANYIQDNFSEDFFNEFSINKNEVVELVRHHFTPLSYIQKMWNSDNFSQMEGFYQELSNKLNELPISKNKLMTLFYADTIGKSSNNEKQENIIMVYEHLVEKKHTLKDIYQKQIEMKSRDN